MLTDMDTLDGMKTIIAVVETGSITAASERLGMSKALVSKYLAAVEQQLGVRLFNRSTRRLAITEAGNRYYENALPLLEEFGELVDRVSGDESNPRGLLRISAPVTFGELTLGRLLPKFQRLYPDIRIDLQLSNNRIDMLEEGIDLVLRIGGVDDSNLVARQLRTLPLVLFASPAYLAEFGTPQRPSDLAQHQCLVDSNFRFGKQWPFLSTEGGSEVIEVNSIANSNSPNAIKSMALAGGGIGFIPRFIVDDVLQSGELVQVLSDYQTLEFGLFALYPHRRYLAKKVRCLIDFLDAELAYCHASA
jgi:DNA-binding transcriptional LysR family regulator